ncbi:MAG: fascin domain-containing protein [Paraclostridium sp.]|uniref:fascin domain-containing protein n=1 Tax=Paraclostridium sp. TaxID=2023273 RepID=UPI003F332103
MKKNNTRLIYFNDLYKKGIIKKDTYEKILRDLSEEKQKLVTIKSNYNNKYVSVYGENNKLVAIKDTVELSDRFILVDNGDETVIIQTQDGYYVEVNNKSNTLAATAVDKLSASIFSIIFINSKEIALRDQNGNYVEVKKDGELISDSKSQNEKTSFKIKEVTKIVNDNMVIISLSEQKFVTAIDGGGSYLSATEFNQTYNEEFTILQFLDGSAVIKTIKGYYIRIADDKTLVADIINIEDATRFEWEAIEKYTIIIKTLNGDIVRVRDIDKYLVADGKEITDNCKFNIYKSTLPY